MGLKQAQTDNLKNLQSKMLEWIENECISAWLIDPEEKKTFSYSQTEVEIVSFNDCLLGNNNMVDFKLNLSELIDFDK